MVLYVVVCVAMIVIVVRIWYCSGLRCNFLGRFVDDIDEVNVLVFIPVVSRFLWFLGGFGHIWFEIPNTGCWVCLQSCRCDYPGSIGSIEARYLSAWCGGMFGMS